MPAHKRGSAGPKSRAPRGYLQGSVSPCRLPPNRGPESIETTESESICLASNNASRLVLAVTERRRYRECRHHGGKGHRSGRFHCSPPLSIDALGTLGPPRVRSVNGAISERLRAKFWSRIKSPALLARGRGCRCKQPLPDQSPVG